MRRNNTRAERENMMNWRRRGRRRRRRRRGLLIHFLSGAFEVTAAGRLPASLQPPAYSLAADRDPLRLQAGALVQASDRELWLSFLWASDAGACANPLFHELSTFLGYFCLASQPGFP